ncbi:MAG: hypothetical protein ACRDK3_05870 [Actinomycetota bacterium]
MTEALADGWYLMSTSDLELELANWRSPEARPTGSCARRLTTEEALAFRDRGNLPDEQGRTLRLVLRVDDTQELAQLERRRLEFEPDYQDAPKWRREGSRPINVVPLRPPGVAPVTTDAWWEVPELAALEREYEEHGTAGGVRVPGEYRGFVFKTVLALRSQHREVTPGAISDSIARWLSDEDAARIARALKQLNR